MLGDHPLDILIVATLENAPQLISVAETVLRFLPHPTVSYAANHLGDLRQAIFCNLDNLRAEGSPNGLRDVIAGTDESLESGLDAAEIGFGLSQSHTGACYPPSPVPNDRGDACGGARHDQDQRQRVHLNTFIESADEPTRSSIPRFHFARLT